MNNLDIKILLGFSIFLYLVSAVLFALKGIAIAKKESQSKIKLFNLLAFAFGTVAWILTVVVFIINWIDTKAPPFGNMYHVFVVTSLSLVPAFLLQRYYFRVKGGEFFFIFVAMIILVPAIIKVDESAGWRPPPALQSVYFIPHVFIYMFGYLLMGIAAVNSMGVMIRYYFTKDYTVTPKGFFLSQRDVYSIVKTGFLFLSLGMIVGATWAETAWGRYWGWDIKETWALINWSLYCIYFHIRYVKMKEGWMHLLLIVAGLSILVTMIGINYMDDAYTTSLHTYTKV